MKLHTTLVFTDAARARYPSLKGWTAEFSTGAEAPLLFVQRGDAVRVQGVPVTDALMVTGRLWTVMHDEATLAIALDVSPVI